ncbi:hypothetical protein [Yersinia intermedia]|uniref:hypothetical protein n=1 Tax=Yersinia intermedia TaxID=631 RepID=UPI00119CC94E|nr:hypothetical protein [Yersinia intermedia]
MSDEKKINPAVIPIEIISKVSYDPDTGRLLLAHPPPDPAELDVTLEMSVVLEAKTIEMLLSSIREIEKKLG